MACSWPFTDVLRDVKISCHLIHTLPAEVREGVSYPALSSSSNTVNKYLTL